MLDTLAKTFGQPGNGKLDLNNASGGQLADRLRDPLQRAGVQLSDPQVDALATAIVGWRDQHGGLISNLNDLKGVAGVTPQVCNVLKQESYLAPYTAARDIEIVGPKVGADLRPAGRLTRRCWRWPECWCIFGSGSNGFMAWAPSMAVFHDTIITIGHFLDLE